ncbi:hypothetical protein SBA3_4430005 [Candidatus Sulfopaludibacter sp. SbA3]|nr:hypothetical protein SBA3_4430005 [Candidatus Sulfopaludibacter sp. SbA3]
MRVTWPKICSGPGCPMSQDRRKLARELDKTLSLSVEVDSSWELEKLQLLLAVAERIQDCPNQFSLPGENPALDLWLNLLKHIASQDAFETPMPTAP